MALNNDNCNSIFRVPSHLVKSYGGNLPSKVTIRLDDSGKKWTVSIEKFKDHYFFTDGWKEFAEKVGPNSLHLIKFMYDKNKKKRRDEGMAARSVLEKDKGEGSGVVNGTSSIPDENKDKCSPGDVNGTSSIADENKDKYFPVETMLSFSMKMKHHHRYRLNIPKKFGLSTGLQKDMKLRIKDGEAREWPVQVNSRNRDPDHLCLSRGWCDFVKANNVMLGSTISVTWLSEGMLETQIVNGTTPIPDENKDNCSPVKAMLSFSKEMNHHHRYRLDLSKDFVLSTGIQNGMKIRLKDGEGREWPVQVKDRKKNPALLTLRRGWCDFVKGNNVMLGSTISFTWLSEGMLETQIVDVGATNRPLKKFQRRQE